MSRLLCLIVALVCLLTLMPVQPASASSSNVNLVVLPAFQTVSVGETFSVTIEAQCGTSNPDGIGIFLDYDPDLLAVQSVAPGSSFSIELLAPTVDNDNGTFGYSAGQMDPSYPNGTFTALTLTLEAKKASPAALLSFHTSSPRKTYVDSGGTDITGILSNGAYTLQDITPPAISTVIPADNATSVAVDSSIVLSFSKPMGQTATQNAFSIFPAVSGSFEWSADNQTMTFTPAVSLEYSTIYQVGLSTSAQDAGGIAPTSAFSSSFTTQKALTSIEITPASVELPQGLTQQFSITPTYSDGTHSPEPSVIWSSSDSSRVSINGAGLATALAATSPGSPVIITASAASVPDATAAFNVTPAVLEGIAVAPQTAIIARGLTQQFVAVPTYSDGSHSPAPVVNWSSSDNATATIGSSGLATALKVTSLPLTVSATCGGFSGSASLTITPEELISIVISPLETTLAKGRTQLFAVVPTYSDGSHSPLPALTWSSSDTQKVTIDSSGLATAAEVTSAPVTITAASGSVNSSALISVTPAVLDTLEVQPSGIVVAQGLTQQLTAVPTYSDGTHSPMPEIMWSSSDPSRISVDSNGLATSLAITASPVTISAASGSVQGSCTLSVTPPILVNLTVSPAYPAAPAGNSLQFTATGTYSDNSSQDLTDSVTWASSDLAKATISAGGGLACCLAAGQTTITAALATVSGSTTLTVSPPPLVGLTVAPPDSSLEIGSSLQFTATGTFSDNSTQNLTSTVNWSSSDSSIATINPTTGLAQGQDAGQSTITATIGAISSFTILTVTAIPTIDLVLSPAAQTVTAGQTFTVQVVAQCGVQTTDGIDVFLDFDPTYLSVQSALPGAALSFVLIAPTFDNNAGTFVYSAGKIGQPFPNGTFTVVSLTFLAKRPATAATAVIFHTAAPRACLIDSAGRNVTGNLSGGSYTLVADPVTISTASALPDAEVGLNYSQSLAAAGGAPPYTWSLMAGNLPAGLSLSPAGQITGTPQTAVGPVTLTLRATDTYGTPAIKDLTLQVFPAPTITTSSPLNTAEVGLAYSQTLTSSGGKAPFTWTLQSGSLPAGLTLDPSGILGGIPTAAGGPDNLTFNLTDGLGVSVSGVFSLEVLPAIAVTTNSPLATGEVGIAYSQTLTSSGGKAPFTWTLQSGSLPAGLTLNPSGSLGGTPTAAFGPDNLAFCVSDALGGQAAKALSLEVVARVAITTSTPLATGEVGLAYTQTLTSSGGKAPFTWILQSGSLPAGLTLDPSGSLSGAPAVPFGPDNLTFSVSDSLGGQASKALSLEVVAAVAVATDTPLATGEVGLAYTQTLTSSGGKAPFAWTLQSGNLPPGLTLNPSGSLSGAPAVPFGPDNLTFSVSDSLGGQASKALSLEVVAAVAVTTDAPLATGEVGLAYTQTLTSSGGKSPFTWTLQSGSLPAGLTLDPSGSLSGTPAVPFGPDNLTFSVSDSLGGQAAKALSLEVVAAVAVATDAPLATGEVGLAYSQTLTSSGGKAPFTWTLQSGSLPAGLTLDPSGSLSGTPAVPFGPDNLTFSVSDSLGGQAAKALSLEVVAAVAVATDAPLATGEVGLAYGQTLASSGGKAPFTWTLQSGSLPAGLTLNPSGSLSGTPAVPFGPDNLTFSVSDSLGGQAAKALSLEVVARVAITTSTPLATGEVGLAYTQTLTSSGGKGPFTWILQSGSLPAGLTLNPSGSLGGTPTAAFGPDNLTFKLTDAVGASVSQDLSILVVAAPSILNSSALPDAEVGLAYSQTLLPSGGLSPFTWSIQSGSLADGLTLSASGQISGTPGAATGLNSLIFKVTDALGGAAAKNFSMTVFSQPVISNPALLPDGEVNAPYSQTLAASGGKSPYVWSVAAGTLGGMSLNAATGLLAGKPTQAGGPVMLSFRVTDSLGGFSIKDFTILILPALAITNPSPLPDGEIGIPYSQSLIAQGGAIPYTWSILSGSLPGGLALDSSGSISGTPVNVQGPLTVVFGLTDGLGGTASSSLSINIAPAPSIATAAVLADGEVGVPYSFSLFASGGVSPFTWAIESGALPQGLSLSSSGSVSGAPEAPGGTRDMTFRVTDSLGGTAVKTLSITIFSQLLVSTLSPLPPGEINMPYSTSLEASGGASPYFWHIISGNLPDGLSLGYSGAISGIPTGESGSVVLTCQVTDNLGGINVKDISLTILAAPAIITESPLENGKVGLFYSDNLSVEGAAPYLWAIASGQLPSGLSLNPSGVISGTPQEAGEFSFTVEVSDSYVPPQSVSRTLSLVILPSNNLDIDFTLQGSLRPPAGWLVPVTVEFFGPGSDVLSAEPLYTFNLTASADNGTASARLTGVVAGTYDISLVSPHCLTNVKRGTVVAGSFTVLNLGALLEGDCNDDNVINIQDFGILASSYLKQPGQTGYDARADFDRNGIVNISDFGLLAGNYGKYSPVER